MHTAGAFIPANIAARAGSDPAGAREDFLRLCRNFNPLLAARRAVDAMPGGILIRHPARLALRFMPRLAPEAVRRAFMVNVFGYGRI
jgi:hypothetical protein